MADFSAGLYLIIVGGKINKTFLYKQKMSIIDSTGKVIKKGKRRFE